MIVTAIFLAGLAFVFPASGQKEGYVLHEKREYQSKALIRRARVASDTILPIRISLAQNNLEHGYDYLMGVAHPSSPTYGRHWTAEEVNEKFAPSKASIDAVKNWLFDSGVDNVSSSKSKIWLSADMSASQAESLFHTEYFEHHGEDGTIRIGCDSYHVPEHLADMINIVKPGVSFSVPVSLERKLIMEDPVRGEDLERRTSGKQDLKCINGSGMVPTTTGSNMALAAFDLALCHDSDPLPAVSILGALMRNSTELCGGVITPACTNALYGIPDNKLNDTVNDLGILEANKQRYDQKDLNLYFAAFAPQVPKGTHPQPVSINGGKSNTTALNATDEPIIDYEVAYPLVYPQTIRSYQVDASDSRLEDSLLDAVDGSYCTSFDVNNHADCGTTNLTRVISISYGFPEYVNTQKEAVTTCNEIMKLTLQGHTFVAAAGDHGVDNPTSPWCINPNNVTGSVSRDLNGTVFGTNLITGCPYVLTVGGTRLTQNANGSISEVAAFEPALNYSSGGGFSNYFPAPDYQNKTLAQYFDKYDPGYATYNFTDASSLGANGGRYNRGGRGYPDVSASSQFILGFFQGKATQLGGTSAAAPFVASVLTRINQERTAAGKGPVGFVNPVFYEHPEIFNDITSGRNPGCSSDGYSAVPGWDPVTGLGSPNYPAMLNLFLSLP